MAEDIIQQCSTCKRTKTLPEFSKDSRRKNGYQTSCKPCQSIRSESWRKRNPERNKKLHLDGYRKRIQKGLCKYCIKERLENHSQFCKIHYLYNVAKAHFTTASIELAKILEKKLEHQNFLCPYTKEVLVLGLNTHLDHIYPTSRFPKLRYDIDNVEWVSKNANLAKSNMTKTEFIYLCKQVAKNF